MDERVVSQGDFTEASKLDKTSLKVYISGTHTDTLAERHHLMREIQPKLCHFCHSRGIDFSMVDFRSRDNHGNVTNDHMTQEIFWNEIDECFRESIDAPCFVHLSFNQYGVTSLPRAVDAEVFDIILAGIRTTKGKELVRKWYIRDGNSLPNSYILQPISTELPDIVQDTG